MAIPIRFAQVNEKIFRGAKPDSDDKMQYLHSKGVTMIIDLRREKLPFWEYRKASHYGIEYCAYPFLGVRTADESFFDEILAKMHNHPGKLYVHCVHGRDRTSLIIALYRVIYEHWDMEEAWQREVLAYDHDENGFLYKGIRKNFDHYLSLGIP